MFLILLKKLFPMGGYAFQGHPAAVVLQVDVVMCFIRTAGIAQYFFILLFPDGRVLFGCP